jgi:myo-inositol 2-dehydrogenase / D-chiro-inositol 1-dehydrogenase
MSIPASKIGLIGAGRIGRLHAEHLSSRIRSADLVMVADAVEEVARQCAQRYAIPSFTNDYREVLTRADIEAVVICTSTDTHAQIIQEAAQAGKHIFCEKPIALDLPSIDLALHAVEQAGVKFQLGFNRRFDANFQRVRQAIVRGEIGQVQQFHVISRDPAPPPLEYLRVSGGIFLDMMIHDFDMVRFLTGDDVAEVFAVGEVMGDPEIAAIGDVDSAVVTLRMANGDVLGTISNSRQAAYGYDQRVEVLGSKGAISIGNNYPNTAIISDQQGIRRDLPLHFFLERYTESFINEMNAFLDAVQNDTAVPVTGDDGRMAVLIALAARRSLEERRPVRVFDL